MAKCICTKYTCTTSSFSFPHLDTKKTLWTMLSFKRGKSPKWHCIQVDSWTSRHKSNLVLLSYVRSQTNVPLLSSRVSSSIISSSSFFSTWITPILLNWSLVHKLEIVTKPVVINSSVNNKVTRLNNKVIGVPINSLDREIPRITSNTDSINMGW